MSKGEAVRNKDSEVLAGKVSDTYETKFLCKIKHCGTSKGKQGFTVNITVSGPARRGGASLYALVQSALRTETFVESEAF